jgi:Tol biopolymer transport system component
MTHDDQLFTPDEVDEQIDWLERTANAQPPTPNARVIRGLHTLFENEQADAQSADIVWQRLLERGAVPAPELQRSRRSGLLRRQPRENEALPQPYTPAARPRRSFPARLLTIAAAVLLVVVVGGLVAGLVLVRQQGPGVAHPKSNSTATPGGTPAGHSVVAYIGSDGNVWEMAWPDGTPQKLTTDAKPNGITYEGLSWSPDGSALAVQRFNSMNPPQGAELIVLAPNGNMITHAALPQAMDYSTPVAWSPDSKQIAYRATSPGTSINQPLGEIVLVNAQTGATIKTLTYNNNQGGCGGGGYPPLLEAIMLTHHSLRVDTFVWSPDQRDILVSQGCDDGAAETVNVNTGAQTPGIPIGVHYQPGGNLILGLWSDGTLGLSSGAFKAVRTLQAPQDATGYDISLGASTWSPDGQVIYFEHNNGIWRINVDGSGEQELLAGKADDAQKNATAFFAPSVSPDGTLLLYAKAQGSDSADFTQSNPVPPVQWYVAQVDGSNPQPLPQGVSEVAWRP